MNIRVLYRLSQRVQSKVKLVRNAAAVERMIMMSYGSQRKSGLTYVKQ